MRFISYFLFSVAMTFSTMSQAGPAFAFSDVSAGVFRFQVKLAEQGNAEAQYKVGEMYEMGKGVPRDNKQALEWFEKSAKQGHKKSSYKILFLEIKSNGLNDFTKSQLGSIRNEAETGNADAQYYLGKMYASGVGVPKSLNNALTWLNKATFNGVSEAEFEAIAVEEELNRVRDREARQRASGLAAAKKKKADEANARKAKQEKEREIAARRNEERRNDARRLAEQKRRDQDRMAAAAAAAQNERDKQQQQQKQQKKAQQAQAADKAAASEAEKASFESDPCQGKKARFLSTCK